MSALAYQERPARGAAEGLLVLHHGRGADERDLLGLADVLDPMRRLHVVTPGGPLTLRGWPGKHWYVVPRVGYPDRDTFEAACASLATFYEETWDRTGIDASRTVLGGFSMGAVMSYAMGLGADRPSVAGILAFSGFIPTVEGWMPDLTLHEQTRVFITHGRRDPVIGVEFARRASKLLIATGLGVDYHESGGGHNIDPVDLPLASSWLKATFAPLGERLGQRPASA